MRPKMVVVRPPSIPSIVGCRTVVAEDFRAASDGRVWDADLHAAEMIGRYLFLKPKSKSIVAAQAA